MFLREIIVLTLKECIMKELMLNNVVKLEKRDLKEVKGGTIKPQCACGCAQFNGLDNEESSTTDGTK